LIRYLCFVLLFTSVFSTMVSAMDLISQGQIHSVIVVGNDAIPAEQSAAKELQIFLNQISGAEIPIVVSANPGKAIHRVFIGQTDQVKNLLPKEKWANLQTDGILIKTVGNDLVIAGGRPRGTLYAVYEFLEMLGIRFFAPDETFIPEKKTISFRNLDTRYTPQFRYREVTFGSVINGRNMQYCVRMHLNGHFHPISPEIGGSYKILGFVHTFDQFLPASEYFNIHPEWFSESNGKRVGGQMIGQLCLTNKQMTKEFIRLVLERIRKNPEAGIISVSQNDGAGPCECAQCTAAVKKLGSQTDLMLTFVNEVAEAVEKDYPTFLIDTLAYSYTQSPPKTVRPRKNVQIRLCTSGNFSKPLTSPVNKSCLDALNAWTRMTDNLSIWDYTVGFANLHMPYPNTQVLSANIRTFRAKNAMGVHEQGDLYNQSASLQPLKVYLFGKLLWNPSLNQDKLTHEFLNGYYGYAGPYIYEYIKLLETAIKKKPMDTLGSLTTPYLTPELFVKAFRIFDNAVKVVAGDPKLLKRVKIQRMAIEQAWFRVPLQDRDAAMLSLKFNEPQMLEEYIKLAEGSDNRYIRESVLFSWDDFRANAIGDTEPNTNPIPDRVKSLAPTDWKEIRLTRAMMANPAVATMVDDSQAISGKAIKLDGGSFDWAAQFFLTPFDLKEFNRGEIIISVKCIGRASEGKAFELGIYDLGNSKFMPSKTYALDNIKDDAYHEYSVGTHDLLQGMYIYVAPPGNSKLLESMYVDRVYIVKAR